MIDMAKVSIWENALLITATPCLNVDANGFPVDQISKLIGGLPCSQRQVVQFAMITRAILLLPLDPVGLVHTS